MTRWRGSGRRAAPLAGLAVAAGLLAAARPVARGGPAGADSAAVAPDPAATARDPGAGVLAVRVVGVRVDQGGKLLFLLFRGEGGWLEAGHALRTLTAPADAESVEVSFADVPRDTAYALEVIHDRNGDGRLNMRIFPYPRPKEGAGVSNNHTRRGKPRWAPAHFAVAGTATLRVVMRY